MHGASTGALAASSGEAAKVDTKSNPTSWKKDFAAAAKSDPSLGSRTRGTAAAAAIALDTGIRSAYATLPVGGGGGGAGSSGGGWDDNFGDGEGDDSCGSSGDDFWDDCCDNDWNNWYWNSWYPGYWGWWSNWGWYWRPGMGFYCGSWFGPAYWSWYSSPYYSYPYYHQGSSWAWNYCTPIVVSTTIQTTEIIEVPVVEEVAAPTVGEEFITGAEVGSPEEVKSALQRAAVEYLSLGDRAFAEARYGDAVRHYARSVECSPQDPVLHLVLSDALFATGDYHYAAHSLRRALELNPDILEVEFNKREFYGDPSDFDRHLLLLKSYLNDHVLDDDARLLLGANLLFGGDPDATVALFSDALGEAIRNSDAGRLLLAAAHRSIAAR